MIGNKTIDVLFKEIYLNEHMKMGCLSFWDEVFIQEILSRLSLNFNLNKPYLPERDDKCLDFT